VHLAACGLLQCCAGALERITGAAQGRAGAAQSQAGAQLGANADGRRAVCGKQQAVARADHGRGAGGVRSGCKALHGAPAQLGAPQYLLHSQTRMRLGAHLAHRDGPRHQQACQRQLGSRGREYARWQSPCPLACPARPGMRRAPTSL